MEDILRQLKLKEGDSVTSDVVAYCNSEMHGIDHLGFVLVNPRLWTARGQKYTGNHSCHPRGQAAGCRSATQLRAVMSFLSRVRGTPNVLFRLTDEEALRWFNAWRGGNRDMPAWYETSDRLGGLNSLASQLRQPPRRYTAELAVPDARRDAVVSSVFGLLSEGLALPGDTSTLPLKRDIQELLFGLNA